MVPVTSMSLTILIVTWNSWGDLKRCIESIRSAAAGESEILVFDNGSIDGTADKVRQHFPEVRLELSAINLGLPPAVNQGLRSARGDYVMLLDVDTEVKRGTARRLFDFMQERRDVALVAPRIYTPEGNIEPSARNLPSAMNGLFGRQSVLTRLLPNNRFSRRYMAPQNLGNQEPFRVEQVSAACMFMRRTLVEEVGPWDEEYRCYWVDSDWCAQIKQAGKQVYCVPDVGIVHYENNRAGKKKSTWRIRHFHIGAYRFYRKHHGLAALDPRSLFAASALAVRAAVILVLNEFKSDTLAQPRRAA